MNLPDRMVVATSVRGEVKLKAISHDLLCSTGAESIHTTNSDQSGVKHVNSRHQQELEDFIVVHSSGLKKVFYKSCLLIFTCA